VIRLAAIVCMFIAVSAVWSEEPPSRQIRVLTYNIHHGEGVDRKLDLPRIASVITAVKPDLVALQEVDQGVERSKRVDQLVELAKLTKMQGVFGGNFRFQGGDYGNGVLSRWPIQSHRNHKLPSFDDGEPRGVLETEIEVPQAGTLTFLATHFDYRPDDRERLGSVQVINGLKIRPCALLAGDLNAPPESKTLESLSGAGWQVANDKPLATVPVDTPERQIDFVLYRPARRFKTVEVRVLDEAVASDHRAVLAVLEWIPATK
jgi:endonuclease/exonuclease/phosphatase family metal-dependent hydrolase